MSNEGNVGPIKVVIADDHRLFRKALMWLFSLENDIVVVGEAETGDEVGKIIKNTKPDVLLLDLKFPEGKAVQIMSEVYRTNPATKVLILTAFSEKENILKAAKAGARGYVLKGVDASTLIHAIKTVYGGGIWVDKEIPTADQFEEIVRALSGNSASTRRKNKSHN